FLDLNSDLSSLLNSMILTESIVEDAALECSLLRRGCGGQVVWLGYGVTIITATAATAAHVGSVSFPACRLDWRIAPLFGFKSSQMAIINNSPLMTNSIDIPY
ncbi:MAG TPA: hypothetical protein VMS21_06770, partial [Methylomirabilota bacterium]|nr:hypothetical protein [Methylomirabilota bacterium]